MMSNMTHYSDHVGANPSKVFKSTLFRSERLMLGLNCLHPGQEQHPHVHGGQDKFYFVVEGSGEFVVGDERRTAGEGMVVWAPADVSHGVVNTGSGRLVLLVGIAPFPSIGSA
jgi:mannose-6-phosphate isomerase-like protein (cupin superfamily)